MKFFNSKILIIGAGGLGCPLLLYLAYSGAGNLGIVDNDKIEISNLSRQVLFTKNDLGKFKATISKKFIRKINNTHYICFLKFLMLMDGFHKNKNYVSKNQIIKKGKKKIINF